MNEITLESILSEAPRNGVYKPKSHIGKGVKLIRMGELFHYGELNSDLPNLQLLDVTNKEKEKLKLCKGDLLFSRTSVVAEGVGKCAIVNGVSDDLIYDSNIIRLRIEQSKADPKYIYYFFASPQGRAKIRSLASGAAVTTITGKGLIKLPIMLPDMDVQRRTTDVLSSYDNLIENNNRRIAILEEMAQSLYREWFVKFRFPGYERCQMVGSPLGIIPTGWRVSALKDVCQLTMGQSPKSEFYNDVGDGLPFYQGVKDYGKRFPSVSIWCNKPTRIAEQGEILFSVRAPVGRLNIANERISIGRGLSAIRYKGGYQSFLFQQLKNIFTREDLIGNGAIFNAVTKKDMEQIQLISPTENVLKEFVSILDPIFRQLEILCIKNENLKKQRDLLLPKLISGQIDLSQAEQGAA